MASPPPETWQQADEHLARPQDLLSFKQLEKLNLEIASLQNKIERIEKYSPFFPLVGSLVTVIAILAGFWQFQRQQRSLQEKAISEQQQERTKRLQDQLRSDVAELSRFTQDKNQSISRVSFLLDDIDLLIASGKTIPEKQTADDFARNEQQLTRSLVKQIVDDTDFMKSPKDVSFANTISNNWSNYRNYMKDQLETLDSIISKYVRALRSLRERNASYFNELIYDENTESYLVRTDFERAEDEEILFQHMKQILEGFKQHLGLISADQNALASDIEKREKVKRRQITAFGDALCIRSVAIHILGDDVVIRPCMER